MDVVNPLFAAAIEGVLPAADSAKTFELLDWDLRHA